MRNIEKKIQQAIEKNLYEDKEIIIEIGKNLMDFSGMLFDKYFDSHQLINCPSPTQFQLEERGHQAEVDKFHDSLI